MACSSCEIGIDEMTWSHGYSVRVPSAASATTATALPSSWRMPTTRVSMTTLQPLASTRSRQRSHIIPGPYFGYWNSSMSEVIVLLVALGQQRVHDRVEQREVLDALGGEVGRQLVDRDAPELLVVGLEEVPVEAPAEAGDDPALERRLVLRRADAGPDVGQHAAGTPRQMPRFLQRVRRLQRVVVVLALVVDAAHAGPQHEVLVGQDLVPEGLDLLHLGEEAVAADVEAPAVALDGAADAADHRVGLEDRRRDAVPGRPARRRR